MKGSDLYLREYHFFPEFRKAGFDMTKMDGTFILTLQKFREQTNIPMMPSPKEGAFYRTDKESECSRHYAVDRLSDAGDFFPEKHRVLDCWLAAIQSPHFGGIGLYCDTEYKGEPWPMLHIDTRPFTTPCKALWIRGKGVYHGRNSKEFWNLVAKVKETI